MVSRVSFNDKLLLSAESDVVWQSQTLLPYGTHGMRADSAQQCARNMWKQFQAAEGARVRDRHGNDYLDLDMDSGSMILGYCHPEVHHAIRQQLCSGVTLSSLQTLKQDLTEMVHAIIPNAQSVRWARTGGEAASTAVRLARAFTGRERIVRCGRYGWQDWYAAFDWHNKDNTPDLGALADVLDYGDLDSLLAVVGRDTACVILEPLTLQQAESGFLEVVREVCDRFGALLVFDEMCTGVRCGLGGAQEYVNVQADLTVFSRTIANGMPLGVIAGRRDVLRVPDLDGCGYTTLGGEALSLAAARACLRFISENPVVEYIDHLGVMLMFALQHAVAESGLGDCVGLAGYPFRSALKFDFPGTAPQQIMAFIQQALFRRGILWSGTHNLSFCHTEEDIDYVAAAFTEAFSALREGLSGSGIQQGLWSDLTATTLRLRGAVEKTVLTGSGDAQQRDAFV